MSGLMRLVPTALPVSAANLLLFFYWYHLSNAQTKFLRYDEFLAQANGRFIASGFVAGSLVLLRRLGGGLIFRRLGHHPQRVAGRPAAALNTLIVTPGVLLITQSANFDPPLWMALEALVLLLMLNTALLAAWERLPQIASTLIISRLMMAGYMMSAVGLFVIPIIILGPKRSALAYSTISLLVAAMPAFWILAAGPLGVWRWRYQAWQRPRATFLGLGVALLWVPCFAAAHYALASDVHYITGVGNLTVNARLALVCGPALAGRVALTDALVVQRLPTWQATSVE